MRTPSSPRLATAFVLSLTAISLVGCITVNPPPKKSAPGCIDGYAPVQLDEGQYVLVPVEICPPKSPDVKS
jgi:hypothetical protein